MPDKTRSQDGTWRRLADISVLAPAILHSKGEFLQISKYGVACLVSAPDPLQQRERVLMLTTIYFIMRADLIFYPTCIRVIQIWNFNTYTLPDTECSIEYLYSPWLHFWLQRFKFHSSVCFLFISWMSVILHGCTPSLWCCKS